MVKSKKGFDLILLEDTRGKDNFDLPLSAAPVRRSSSLSVLKSDSSVIALTLKDLQKNVTLRDSRSMDEIKQEAKQELAMETTASGTSLDEIKNYDEVII